MHLHQDYTTIANEEEVKKKALLNKTKIAEKPHGTLKKDYKNIALLLFLYMLQGLPLGLTGSLPYILGSRKVSYAEQGIFSFAFWPFSIKLLWAPLVDGIYVKKFGKRKSWLIPVQYLIGIFMFTFSGYVHHLLELNKTNEFDNGNGIYILTGIFFMFTFLAATQDVVIDGWALTMLSKENVAWSSTCNSVGQSIGWFIGNVIFLVLESYEFCNKYIRPYFGLPNQEFGLVTFSSFMNFFGFVFIISTTLIMIFKNENDTNNRDNQLYEQLEEDETSSNFEDSLSVTQIYKLIWKLLWTGTIAKFTLILLTYHIGFATESMTVLKLIEKGVPKESLGLLAIPLTPLQIIFPLLFSKQSNGPKPLTFFVRAIPFRLLMVIVCCLWIYVTPYFKDENNEYPLYYYLIIILINAVHSLFCYMMSVAQVSFFAKVSDTEIGATYMTFLNTMSNLGGEWPNTLAFFLADYLTFKNCSFDTNMLKSHTLSGTMNVTTILDTIDKNFCSNDEEIKECVKLGGVCVTSIDAYYVESAIFFTIGFIWLLWKQNLLYKLENLPKSAWRIITKESDLKKQ